MIVKELIRQLKLMPAKSEVKHVWDGAARTTINHVWLAKSGDVMTADSGESVYYAEERPVNAPEIPDWSTSSDHF